MAYFWTALILAICLEWEVITALVKFQSLCNLAEMGIKKKEFNGVIERRIIRSHVALNIFNLLWHCTVIYFILIQK